MGISRCISLIQEGNEAKAYEVLPKEILSRSIQSIIHKQGISKEEAISIFFDGFQAVAENIKSNKFVYESDANFINYLHKICLNKAIDYKKQTLGYSYLVPPEKQKIPIEDIEDEFFDALDREVKKKEKTYGISLDMKELVGDEKAMPVEFIEAFHQLKEECKLLIILKNVVNLSHKDIYETLSIFYKMKNPKVCKMKLLRCRKALQSLLK